MGVARREWRRKSRKLLRAPGRIPALAGVPLRWWCRAHCEASAPPPAGNLRRDAERERSVPEEGRENAMIWPSRGLVGCEGHPTVRLATLVQGGSRSLPGLRGNALPFGQLCLLLQAQAAEVEGGE